jgi:hypothetical protein
MIQKQVEDRNNKGDASEEEKKKVRMTSSAQINKPTDTNLLRFFLNGAYPYDLLYMLLMDAFILRSPRHSSPYQY